MTKKTEQKELTALQSAMLDILKANGGWMSRDDIAKKLGRNKGKLYPNDIDNLNALVSQKLVVSKKAQVEKGVYQMHFVYRLSNEGL